MAVAKENSALRIYGIAFVFFMIAIAITVKLTNIQWVEGDYYRKLAKDRTVKKFVIPANKGNIYSADGSLLATSIPNFNIRFDALAPKGTDFEKEIKALSDSLSSLLSKPSSTIQAALRQARNTKNRYFLIAKNLNFTDFDRLKNFPLLSSPAG